MSTEARALLTPEEAIREAQERKERLEKIDREIKRGVERLLQYDAEDKLTRFGFRPGERRAMLPRLNTTAKVAATWLQYRHRGGVFLDLGDNLELYVREPFPFRNVQASDGIVTIALACILGRRSGGALAEICDWPYALRFDFVPLGERTEITVEIDREGGLPVSAYCAYVLGEMAERWPEMVEPKAAEALAESQEPEQTKRRQWPAELDKALRSLCESGVLAQDLRESHLMELFILSRSGWRRRLTHWELKMSDCKQRLKEIAAEAG